VMSAGNWLGGGVNGDQRAWQALLRIAQIIEGFDAQARDVNAQRGAMAQERDRLQQHQLEIERLRTMRTTADQELAAARQTVAQFDDANRGLIQAATDEMPVVVHHQRVK
ncbi:ATPase, partial [Pseudomonas aeruginosa]|nr:ATPase [Pseudomonas aeruginosa]